ncbi:MAG: ostA-like family protein [Alphaproteobacteria bacterium]|nr:ostA-like family protein [Alphaproteobacteria bacterium]MCD8526506.1 ostA-like family protein [Alphaproteobacteria bacterium]MCD8570354.1 ostA-like family protein [Alphaproteobacteria bacterium]
MKLAALITAFTTLYACTYTGAYAQELIKTSQGAKPVEITADKTLEWDRNSKNFTANGNAKAKQGDTSVEADVLKARYRSTSQKSIDVRELEAIGNVVLTSKDSKAYGDRALYSLDTNLAVMTGGNLSMTAPNGTVTAQERFEYWTEEGRLEAIGDAEIHHKDEKGQTNTLKADHFTAFLTEDSNGKQALKTLEAKGNVVITTPAETLEGTYGIYDALKQTAEITGGVTITRGPNTLEGESASVDLKTGVSTLTGSGTADGQVRGVFYPETAPKEETASP